MKNLFLIFVLATISTISFGQPSKGNNYGNIYEIYVGADYMTLGSPYSVYVSRKLTVTCSTETVNVWISVTGNSTEFVGNLTFNGGLGIQTKVLSFTPAVGNCPWIGPNMYGTFDLTNTAFPVVTDYTQFVDNNGLCNNQ